MLDEKLKFEWDENKRLSNIDKHGLDFYDVASVFLDEHKVYIKDTRNSYGEIRYNVIGMKDGELLSSVCHTNRNDKVRIISFRPASRKERKIYYGQNS